MVSIRRYRTTDAEAVKHLHRVALRDVGTDPADVPGTEDLDDIETAYLDSGGEFLVAEIEGELVGMGGLKVDGTEAELFRMRVHPDHQRDGIGSALLDRLEAAARERGVETLSAETARRQAAATRFYPDHGYSETGQRTVGEYELLDYEKQLQS